MSYITRRPAPAEAPTYKKLDNAALARFISLTPDASPAVKTMDAPHAHKITAFIKKPLTRAVNAEAA